MKRHLLSAIILSLVFCVAVACGEKKKDEAPAGGENGGGGYNSKL